MILKSRGALGFLAAIAVVLPAVAQQGRLPENVDGKAIEIWSDGTKLAGNLFWPKDKADQKLPAIVLCHGWGGVKQHLNSTYGPFFAAAGFRVLTFDYRGWGESDSRMVLVGKAPKPDATGHATVEVQMIREVVDPFDELEDIQSAIDWLVGEPGIDTDKIGLWGTSFGGGLVLWTATHDPRVKCIVSQVGAVDGQANLTPELLTTFTEARTKRARGELPPVPQGEDVAEGLRGTPYMSKFIKYRPVDFAEQLSVPILIIDAEKEELFDIKKHGGLVYEKVKDRVPAKYHIELGITHYGIYRERYKVGSEMARDWFVEHLK